MYFLSNILVTFFTLRYYVIFSIVKEWYIRGMGLSIRRICYVTPVYYLFYKSFIHVRIYEYYRKITFIYTSR